MIRLPPDSAIYATFLLLFTCGINAYAKDSLTANIGLDLAKDIAYEGVRACRKMGYQVSAVVVDINGSVQVALRDELAPRFTLQIAEEKASSVILSAINSAKFRRSREDLRQQRSHMNATIIMQGALPLEIAGSRVGAIGISGAPGGYIDERCARQALDVISQRINFTE